MIIWHMEFYKLGIFFVAVWGSGMLSMYFLKESTKYIKYLLAFTGAFILGITFIHLVPVAYLSGTYWVGILVLAGFLVQLILENLSKGIEHGHIHQASGYNRWFAWQVLLGLSVHSFIEGMPLAENLYDLMDHSCDLHDHHHGHQHHSHQGSHLFWGIIAHHIPAALALVALFLGAGFTRLKTGLALLVFTLMTPLGAYSAGMISWTEEGFSYLIALVIGTFLHVATTILFEQEEGHQMSWRRWLLIVLGLALAVVTSL